MVLAWFPITSSWNTACHIRGLIHGISQGVPNDWGGCASVVESDRITGEAVSVYMLLGTKGVLGWLLQYR